MKEKPHKCKYCEKAFVTSTNLKSHVKTHIKREEKNTFQPPVAQNNTELKPQIKCGYDL